MVRRARNVMKVVRGGVIASALLFLLVATTGFQLHSTDAASSNVSNTPGPSSGPRMVLIGDSLYAVWEEFTDSNLEVFFASSVDGGTIFSESTNLSNTLDGSSSAPKVATSGDHVYVVWQDTFPANDIFLASSTDGGATFGEPINVSNSSAAASPQIAVSEDSVYLAWEDSALGNPDILFASSTDGGATFGEPINVSNTAHGFSSVPQIAVSENGIIYLAWVDAEIATDIFLALSLDGGDTFGEPTNLSNTEGGAPSLSGIAAAGENVYVLWQDIVPGLEIFVAASSDAGANFSGPVNVSANEGISVSPSFFVTQADPASLYVVWVDNTNTGDSNDIFFSGSSDGASTFSEAINVSNTTGSSSNPRVVADSLGNVTVGWSDGTLDPSHDDVLVAVSEDAGATFGTSVNISNNPTGSSLAQLAISPSNETLNILWVDSIDPDDIENTEILLQTGIDTSVPSITIDTISTVSPRWDIDAVEIFGTVGNPAAGDKVSIDWGDGTIDSDIPLSGSSWGPLEHTYPASAIANNPIQITALLLGASEVQKASSDPSEVTVQKHAIDIALNPVLSAREGSEVTASGFVTDSDTGEGVEGLNIEFLGSGAQGILDPVDSGIDGFFTSSGLAPGAESGLTVQAIFAGGNSFNASDSAIRIYDSVGNSTVPFNITAGSNSNVELTGLSFNASVSFEEVVADGTLFVSECTTPESTRYVSLDMCLLISSSVQMAENTSALVTMSFAGIELPAGATASDVAMFHEHGGSIIEVTESRDETEKTITGIVTEFSNFITGIALHEETPPGAQRTQIFVGDGNLVSIRGDKQGNSSANVQATFDKSSYRITQRPVLTIVDENGNLDDSQNDTILAAVMSDSSSPFNIIIPLTESEPNTSTFSGDFGLDRSLTSSELGVVEISTGDQLSTFYISGARAQAVIDDVTEAGFVQLSDYIVDEGVCFKPIGGAIDLQLIDAQLGEDGKITFTLSYENANLRGFDPSAFRMLHKEVATWVDRTISLDSDAMTVTGESTIPGPFTLAADFGSCGGGAGGGLARPGTGLVVDFVASIAQSSGGGGSGSGSTSSGTGGAGQTTSAEVASGNDVQVTLSGSNIVIEFGSVIEQGTVLSKLADPADLPSGSFTEVKDNGNGVMSIDSSIFETVGIIYELEVSHTLQFSESITLTLPYDESDLMLTGIAEENLRLVHFIDGRWEDATVSADQINNTVTGELTSLSHVAVAAVNDGTFGPVYFEKNPLSSLSLKEAVIFDGNLTTNDVAKGQEVVFSFELNNPQRIEQSYIYIVQVVSPSGIVESLLLDSGSLGRGESETLSAGWESNEAQGIGTYDVKILLVSSFQEPQILAPMAVVELELVAGTNIS